MSIALKEAKVMPMNWHNKTIWTGDNLPVLHGMNSESVDLIYLDPPFNSHANYAAPIDSEAAGAEFKDTWTLDEINLAWHGLIKHEHPGLYAMLEAVRRIHGESMMAYLIYMIPRLMELKRLLKPSGSLYLHCDPRASHYLKMILDAIFGKHHFGNEIVWCYATGGASPRVFAKKHDIILFYAKELSRHTFHTPRVPYTSVIPKKYAHKYHKEGKIMLDWWSDVQALSSMNRERTGYPTQKPLALLRRIILASSNEGEMVLDPFCGCATACVAAQQEKRQWTGIDISPKAAELMLTRCREELGVESADIIHRKDIPQRSDLGNVLPYNAIENKDYLYGEQGERCNACGEHFSKRRLTVDHIVPKAKGGTDHISNLQLLCGKCNSTEGDRSHAWQLARLLDKGHARRQRSGFVGGG